MKLIRAPGYEPAQLKNAVLHFGLGHFHRAHQAWYFHRLASKGISDWGVVGLSFRNRKTVEALKNQDFQYHLKLSSSAEETYEPVSIIKKAYFVPDSQSDVLDLFDSSELKWITFTMTEKAYHKNNEVFDFLIQGLKRRHRAGLKSISIVSCDNIHQNSQRIKRILLEKISENDAEFREWLISRVCFANTMVDRIVPATTEGDIDEFYSVFSQKDLALVTTESFSQWVVENHKNLQNPGLEKIGVEFVEDVQPYEKAKLLLLNASHSLMAYIGSWRNHDFVHEAISDDYIRKLVDQLMLEEAAPAVSAVDCKKYHASLVERFQNPSLRHRLLQIAMDGSEKILMRWLPTLEFHGFQIQKTKSIHLALVYWLACMAKKSVSDPRSDEIKEGFQQESLEKFIRKACGFSMPSDSLSYLKVQLSELLNKTERTHESL